MYSTACAGHYGLAAKYYTHFTSPIRRYPDLQIHRILKENLRGGLGEKRRAHYEQILPETALLCTAAERRADEAERETEKMKKCEYMSRHIGEEYEGVISGVTAGDCTWNCPIRGGPDPHRRSAGRLFCL